MRSTSSPSTLPWDIERNWPVIALILVFLLALRVRMIPTRFGTIMDPDAFFMFRMARDVVEKGYFPTWDNLGWQPGGRPLTSEMPMLPFAIAYSYMFLKALGSKMALTSWTILFPAIVGAMTVFPTYLIARELRDRTTGIVAALLIATMPEFLNRTMGGVADKESLAFPLMLMGFAMMIKLLRERDLWKSVLWGLVGGLLLGLVALTWGGLTYVLLLLSAFYAILIVIDILGIYKIPDANLVGLVAMSATLLSVSMGIPNWRLRNPFVLIHVLASLGLLGYLSLTRAAVRIGILGRRASMAAFLVIVITVGLLPVYGPALGVIEFKVARKFIILLNPFESPEEGMHVTVQEYAKPTTSDWLSRYSFYPFLAIAGVFFAVKRRRAEDLFMVLWAGSGALAGQSAIRSTMLLTPALCLLGAIALREFMNLLTRDRSLTTLLASKSRQSMREIRTELRLAKIGAPLAAAALALLVVPSILFGIQLVQGRAPVLGQGWYDALTWLNRETPKDSIVVAWWDYGHWITSVAERRCVSDGATTNFSTIQATAFAYLSPEDVAIKIFERHHVEYVVVPEHDFWLAGAFAQIVGNVTDYPDGYYEWDPEKQTIGWSDLTPKGQNTTVYKLVFGQPDPEANNFELIHQSPGSGVYRDTTVKIYRVNYREGSD